MSEEEKPSSAEVAESTEKPVKKKRRWLRILMYLFAAFVLLLVGGYFYISSAAFVRGQVFSRVSKQLNQQVTAEQISFSPFSSIEIKDFVLGDDPFLKAGRIKLAYELMPMLSNKINVNEITFEDAEIDARFNVDGKLNILSKIVEEIKDEVDKKKNEKKDKKEGGAKKEKSPLVLNINNINFKNLKIRYFKEFDRRDKENEIELELSDFSFSLPTLKSGEEFSFELKTSLKCLAGEIVSDRSKPGFELKNGQLTITGKSKLTEDLKPELVSLDVKLEGLDAYNIGEKLPLEAIQVLTDIGLDGDKITINGIKIADPGKSESAITLKGGVDAKTQDLDLEIGINKVDSALLDLALPVLTGSKPFRRWQESLKKTGDISGFGSTVVDFKGYVRGNPSTKVDAEGNLSISSLPMAKLSPKNASIVPFHTSVIYAASYDKKQAELKKLEIKIDEDKRKLVSMNLENPIKFDIEQKKIVSEKDEEVSFLVRNFDIDYVKAFMGEEQRELVRSGLVTVACNLVSSGQGKNLYVDLKNIGATNLSLKQETGYLDNIAVLSSSRFGISDLKKLSLEGLSFSLLLDGKENISMKAGGEINLDKITADVKVSSLKISEEVRKFLPEDLKKKFKLDNINLNSSGINISYTKEYGMITASGSVDSKGILLGGEQFAQDFRLNQDTSFDVTFDQQQNLTVNKLKVGLKADEKPAVDIDLKGSLNSTTKAMSFQFPAFNVSSAARSFLPPDLISKFKLERINLSAENLAVDMNDARIILKGSLLSKEIGLGGEMFNGNVSLTQTTAFDLTLMKNKDLDLRKLTLQVLTDGEDAVNFEAAGIVKPDSKSIQLTVKQLNVLPGTSRLLPADLIKKFKLKNLNLIGNRISINLVDGQAGQIIADLKTENLELGGTAIKPVTISQTLKIDAAIDSAKQLDLKNFNFTLKPSGINPVEVSATGKVDLNFKKADSKIIIDVPQSIDVNALMALLKKQQPAETAKVDEKPTPEVVADKTTKEPSSEIPVPAPEKATPIKLTVQTSVKELIFEKESIKNVSALAYIDGNKYTLQNAALQIGESIIQASGKFENEKEKVIYASVKSAGLFDLSPVNELMNATTDKFLGGKIEIERMEIKTNGKDDKEIMENLVASGQMFMQDIAVKGYGKSIPSLVSVPVKQVFGPDPDDISFTTGKLKFGMKDKILTIEECEMTGNALLITQTGTIEITDDAYIVDTKVNAGFGGGPIINKLFNAPALMALAAKQKKWQKFQVDFPFNDTLKKITMAQPLHIKKTFKTKTENPTASETFLGLNTLSAEMMNAFFSGVAARANFKELEGIIALGNGDITSGVGGLLENISQREIENLLNRDKDKNNDDDDKKDKKSGIGGLLDGIFGGGDEKKKEPKMTDEQKKELERKKAEEKKKEDEKKKINKEDDLIKGIENIFK